VTGVQTCALPIYEILAVPSLWKEPFGIVALEGMACGCVPLVSDGGGLPEAVGKAGCIFKSGNDEDLANQISRILEDDSLRASLRAAAPSHLARHTARKMAADYLNLIEDAFAEDKRTTVPSRSI
jgi:glycosyltransferase involved in cell wall biosynthesis